MKFYIVFIYSFKMTAACQWLLFLTPVAYEFHSAECDVMLMSICYGFTSAIETNTQPFYFDSVEEIGNYDFDNRT